MYVDVYDNTIHRLFCKEIRLLAFQWVGLQSMHSESVDDNTKCITHLYFLKKLNLILVYEVLKQAHLKT